MLLEGIGCTFFGVPVEDLTHDELFAMAISGHKPKPDFSRALERQVMKL